MSESVEDYLETIYLLSKSKSELHAIDIANELNFSRPSITRALKILKVKGFIETDDFNHINLTDAGLQKAKQIYERHQIITEFLLLNGIPFDIATKDACRMEHYISEETFSFFKSFVLKHK